jgi:FkbM family methyltransferase
MRSLGDRISSVRRLSQSGAAELGTLLSPATTGKDPEVTELGKGAWLVRSRTPAGRRLELEQLDDTAWVLRRRGPRGRVVRRIGAAALGAHLVIDRRSLRRHFDSYEHQLLRYLGEEHVAWLLRRLDVNVVLDVGANRGQFARRLRRDGYTGRIVSFEPVPRIAEKLEQFSADDPDWQVLRHAVGDRDETREMNVGVGQGRLSSLLPATDFGRSWSSRIDAEAPVSVSVRRLDGLFDEAVAGVKHPRVYLKLDTQGYDLQAFAGAGDRVADLVAMQSELSLVPLYDGMPHLTEQLATYEAAGFQVTGMFPVIVDRQTMRVIEFDAVMVRAGALDRTGRDTAGANA